MKRGVTIAALGVWLAAACSSFDEGGSPATPVTNDAGPTVDAGTEGGSSEAGPAPCTNCKPRVLAAGMDRPYGLALDDQNIYVGSESGTIYQVAKATGDRKVLVTGLSSPLQPIVSGDDVYIGTGNGVFRIPKASPATYGVVLEPQTALARNDTHFFGCRYDGGNQHDVVTINGSFATPIASGVVACETIGFNDKYLFFGAATTLNRLPIDAVDTSTPPTVLGNYHARRLVVDGEYVYSTGYVDGKVRRIKIEETNNNAFDTVVEINDGNTELGDLALDETYVYWTVGRLGSPGKVFRVLKNGGGLKMLAEDLKVPAGIAVDAHAIYWSERESGNLWTLEK